MGTLSIDLSRRQMVKAAAAPGDTLWRVRPDSARAEAVTGRRRGRPPAQAAAPRYGAPPGAYGAPSGYGAPPPAYAAPAGRYQSNAAYQGGLVDLPSVSFMSTGARVKVMRHIQFGPTVEVTRSSGLLRQMPALDMGVGLAFELDTAELKPQARLKFRDILSLKALPYPALKIQKRLRAPNSSWGVRLSYECPLENITSFYRPPARLMLAIDNMHSNGVQLTQAGLEFNFAQLFGEKQNAQFRAAGLVALPRELPIVEGQPLAGLDIKRLGFKTDW